jgi:pimeloyl-ACP methyl ester carboxylesterase
MCDLGLAKRLHRIWTATLLLWGDQDAILPVSPDAGLFERGIVGPVSTAIIPDAGHLIDFDEPASAAAAVERFLVDQRALQPV